MKLNNKGWGLGSLIAGIGVFAIALLIVVMIVNNNLKKMGLINTNGLKYNYSTLEEKVESATIKYANKKYNKTLENDTSITVTIKKLQKEGYLDDIYDLKNKSKKCSGYVIISKKNDSLNYEPYINCYNYKTIGYDSKFDN